MSDRTCHRNPNTVYDMPGAKKNTKEYLCIIICDKIKKSVANTRHCIKKQHYAKAICGILCKLPIQVIGFTIAIPLTILVV